jgi:hypothetical protein
MTHIQNRLGLAVIGALLLMLVAAIAGVVYGGPLDPPASPGSTQATQIDTLPYQINFPGSYVLTKNLDCMLIPACVTSNGSGIIIDADDVTLDLNGFQLSGWVSSQCGIVNANPHRNVTIRNGHVYHWPGGGICAANSLGGIFEGLTLYDNANGGLVAGPYSTASHIVAQSSTNGVGIALAGPSTLSDCTASNNVDGIRVYQSIVYGCSAVGNNGDGIWANGLSAISNSRAEQNGSGIVIDGGVATGCTAYLNTVNGIEVAGGGLLEGNDVWVLDGATARGIQVTGSGGLIRGNTVRSSPPGIPSAGGRGIEVTGSNNRIEGNAVRGFDYDYYVYAQGPGFANLVIQNSASVAGNGNFFGSGNDVGPIQTAATGTSPWANINH